MFLFTSSYGTVNWLTAFGLPYLFFRTLKTISPQLKEPETNLLRWFQWKKKNFHQKQEQQNFVEPFVRLTKIIEVHQDVHQDVPFFSDASDASCSRVQIIVVSVFNPDPSISSDECVIFVQIYCSVATGVACKSPKRSLAYFYKSQR